MRLLAGDIYLMAGTSWVSRAIRFFTRSPGEAPSKVSHVGMIVRDGDETNAVSMEALGRGVTRRLTSQSLRGKYAVYRPPWTSEEIAVVVARAMEDDHKKYGWGKVVTSALDWFLGGAYVFRRLADREKTGLDCSYAVWDWNEPPFRARGEQPFGVHRNCSPDDIWDYVNEMDWECVKSLG